jgi:N-acetylglucosamine kinase
MTQQLHRLTDDFHSTLCADLGGTFIKFAVSSQPGQLTHSVKVPMPAQNWNAFVTALQQLCTDTGHTRQPLAISTAGLVDIDQDTVFASNIPAFTGHAFTQELSDALQRPVYVANDADCFTLAEAFLGAAQGERIVFGIILGSGVGGGLVANGQLIQGAGGISGEWGHAPLAKTLIELPGETSPRRIPRFTCGCGQTGCLDTIGGARGLERLHQHLHQEQLDSRSIVERWQQQDRWASITIAVYLDMMAEPLAMIANLTGASCMPVGGGLAAAKPLMQALDARVRPLTLRQSTTPLLVPGLFSAEGGLLGASVFSQLQSKNR